MPKYEVEDTLTGKRYELEGNSPPTEQELEDIFVSQRKDSQTSEKTEPGIYEKYIRPITKPLVELGGMVAGGAIGVGAGVLGAPVGAGLGYAGAKELYRQGEKVLGVAPEEKLSLPQQLTRTGKETAEGITAEMGGQIGGKLIGMGLQKISSPFLKKINPEILQASKEMESITGVGLSPAQKTESGFVDYLENIAEKSFAGGPKFTIFRGKQQEAIKKYADDVVDNLWKEYGNKLSPEQTGQIFKAVVDKKIDVFENTATTLYKNVDKVSEGFNVPLGSLKQFGEELAQVSRSRAGIGSSKMGDMLIRKIGKLPDLVTFQEAQAIRSALGKEIKAMEYSKDVGSGIAKHSYRLVSESIEKSGGELNPRALNAFKEATAFYKEGSDKYFNKFVSRMMEKISQNPEVAVNYIETSKTGDIRKIMSIADEPTKKLLKASYVEKTINDAVNVDGQVLGSSLITKLHRIGPDKMKTLFTNNEIKSLNNVATAARASQKEIKSGGGMMIQLTQWGPILSAPTAIATGEWGIAAGGAGIFLGTRKLAQILTHPVYSKWFAEGLKTPVSFPKTELWLKLAGLWGIRTAEKEQKPKEIGLSDSVEEWEKMK